MSNTVSVVKQALVHYMTAFEEGEKASRLLSRGPADYYFKKIEGYVTALFEKYAPFREGDRVVLIKDVQVSRDSHWYSSRHFLTEGNWGTVASVDYSQGRFIADVIFDNESWIDDKGNVRPAELRHTYCIGESFLSALPVPPVERTQSDVSPQPTEANAVPAIQEEKR